MRQMHPQKIRPESTQKILRNRPVPTAALVAFAGLSLSSPAFAAPNELVRPKIEHAGESAHNRPTDQNYAPKFAASQELLGKQIVNPNGTKLGALQDFAIDRGTGKIRYAVLATGQTFGLGGKTIAIPYESLSYEAANHQFMLKATPEQLKQVTQFKDTDWAKAAGIDTTHWYQDAKQSYKQAAKQVELAWQDPMADRFDAKETVKVKGVIHKIDRSLNYNASEQVVAHVKTKEHGLVKAALGPAWYVMAGPQPPMRGEAISFSAFKYTESDKFDLIAKSFKHGGVSLNVRDDEGRALWARKAEENPESKPSANNETSTDGDSPKKITPMIMLSDLVDMPTHTLTEKGSEIHNAIIETGSGTVAILGVDPNQNVFGLSDTIKAVPWSVAAIMAESVRIDASQRELINAETLAENSNQYNRQQGLDEVYRAFDLEPESFQPRDKAEWHLSSATREN